ncbi:MAG: hypothetical protein JXR97_09520, partial [Planctomycetes bacterium]|nr:hypothetical protein [Planctomycetota bacterium]
EDRLIVFSDGVSQSGLGTPAHRLGWRIEGCSAFVRERIKRNPFISARELARNIVNEALRIDEGHKAKDDISCAVFYFRQPRRLLVTSGPPFDMNKDKEMAYKIKNFNGRTAICGGTTANIVSRELDRKITMPLGRVRSDLPPVSKMEGVDMITEGILTLTRVANYLEERNVEEHDNAAGQLAELFLDSDHVEFMVGTRINDAHQDPTLPVDLEIRRNIIKRIASILNDNYLKDVTIEYI